MRLVSITYGCGFGRHKDEIEVGDEETDEEIERIVEDYICEKFDWSFTIEEEPSK